MPEHPIQGLMKTAMENLKEMADVNKVVGEAVETPDGNVIIPVSRVTFGFVAGGANLILKGTMKIAKRNTGRILPLWRIGGGVGFHPACCFSCNGKG